MKKFLWVFLLFSNFVFAQTIPLDTKPAVCELTKSFQWPLSHWPGMYVCADGSLSNMNSCHDTGGVVGDDPQLHRDDVQEGLQRCATVGGIYKIYREQRALFYGVCEHGNEPCKCPDGYRLEFDEMELKTVCKLYGIAYTAAFFPENPNSCDTAGNPIIISNGQKAQKEIHIPAIKDGVGLQWSYRFNNVVGQWKHQYQKTLTSLSQLEGSAPVAESGIYGSAEDACTQGWNIIKGLINKPQLATGTPQMTGNKCQIMMSGSVAQQIVIRSNQSVGLAFDPSYIQINDHLGGVTIFRNSSQNIYQDTSGNTKSLLRKQNGLWIFTHPNGTVEKFDSEGKLVNIISPSGTTQTLTYDAAKNLINVQDNKGHALVFAYENNKIKTITLDNTKTTEYLFNSNGLIQQVTHPDDTFRIYHYEDSRLPTALTGITDERNVRYATWAYDAQGRAISSEHAGGVEKTLLSFNADGSTTVTNSLGKQTIYRFDYLNGTKRVVKVEGQATSNCLAANKDYTYTPEGWIESKTDWKGIKTTYQYNSFGQEISRTEAFVTTEAKIIKTQWHPEFNVKTKITEPERETIYTYDNNGLLLTQKTRSLITQ